MPDDATITVTFTDLQANQIISLVEQAMPLYDEKAEINSELSVLFKAGEAVGIPNTIFKELCAARRKPAEESLRYRATRDAVFNLFDWGMGELGVAARRQAERQEQLPPPPVITPPASRRIEHQPVI